MTRTELTDTAVNRAVEQHQVTRPEVVAQRLRVERDARHQRSQRSELGGDHHPLGVLVHVERLLTLHVARDVELARFAVEERVGVHAVQRGWHVCRGEHLVPAAVP